MRCCLVLAAALALAPVACGGAGTEKNRSVMDQSIRKPAVAGQFYAPDAAALRREIEGYLAAVPTSPPAGEVVALVSPHAGYMYSGQVAAHGYALVKGKRIGTVVVISPSHVEYFGYASVFAGAAYATPLGEIPVDAAVRDRIAAAKEPLVRIDSQGHSFHAPGRGEHSLEVQLPFLQVVLGSFKLVPIVMGDQDRETAFALGRVLGDALAGENALIVASTDLSHFHSDAQARKLDGSFMDKLRAFDPEGLYREIARRGTEACGGGPVAAAMVAARALGATSCAVLQYANSGDVTGDESSVVGYVSAAMTKPASEGGASKSAAGAKKRSAKDPSARDPSAAASTPDEMGLSREDKIFLLRLARSVIEKESRGQSFEPPPSKSAVLAERRGAFVTLHEDGQLRGCIGYIEAVKPLIETIADMASAAAFNDYRFRQVTAEEVPALDIEISVLSPIRAISDPSTIVVGRHGIIITRGSNRGLLLPQVATEWGWDRETFLAQTCVKAGLPEDAWRRQGTKIEVFTAEIFNEKELGLR